MKKKKIIKAFWIAIALIVGVSMVFLPILMGL